MGGCWDVGLRVIVQQGTGESLCLVAVWGWGWFVQLTFALVKHLLFLCLSVSHWQHLLNYLAFKMSCSVSYIFVVGGRLSWYSSLVNTQALRQTSEEVCVTSEGPEINWAAIWYIHHWRDATSNQSSPSFIQTPSEVNFALQQENLLRHSKV